MKALKINFILAFAMFFSLIAMSFELQSKMIQQLKWYEVEANGDIGSPLPNNLPSDVHPQCEADIEVNICAIQLPDDHSFTNLSEVEGDHTLAGISEPSP